MREKNKEQGLNDDSLDKVSGGYVKELVAGSKTYEMVFDDKTDNFVTGYWGYNEPTIAEAKSSADVEDVRYNTNKYGKSGSQAQKAPAFSFGQTAGKPTFTCNFGGK